MHLCFITNKFLKSIFTRVFTFYAFKTKVHALRSNAPQKLFDGKAEGINNVDGSNRHGQHRTCQNICAAIYTRNKAENDKYWSKINFL